MTDESGHMSAAHTTVVDLTCDTQERVLSICRALAGSGAYVLHGSNVRPALQRIEPRQANDAAKRSGNHVAVYASLDVEAVLMHAVLDRAYLSSRFDSYVVGYRVQDGRLLFKTTDNIYRLFKQRDPQLYSDGYVYAMDRTCFVRSPDYASEFFSFQSLTPQRVLKVSASLGTCLFRIDTPEGDDTVIPYSAEEAKSLAVHVAGL